MPNLTAASLALALHMTDGEGDKWRIIITLDRAAVAPRRVGNIRQRQNEYIHAQMPSYRLLP